MSYSKPMQNVRRLENIALIGFMGTGKSSVGRFIATELGFTFVDTDELIESRCGRRINDIFAQQGEPHFRGLERQLVTEMESWKKTVISTGGGLAANEANLESLKSHALVVCLWASPEKIFDRVKNQSHRPLLHDADPLGKIRQLLASREP
ncbi:MAG TPA: shikimate kinase, partial [Roseimicrobium sp.]|nr:shikimate kinase [Roseimicrobium sp.]